MSRFYRVEHPSDRRGPYVTSTLSPGDPRQEVSCRMNSDHCDDAHPNPYSDAVLGQRFSHAHVCGCATITALRQWFAGWGPQLAELGYQLVAYETSKRGPRGLCDQVVVKPGDALEVWRRPIEWGSDG